MQGPNDVPHSTNDGIIVSWLVANSAPNFQLNVNLPQELFAPSEVRFPKKYSKAEICGKSYLRNTSGINSRRVKESGLGRGHVVTAKPSPGPVKDSGVGVNLQSCLLKAKKPNLYIPALTLHWM